jgi:hypothetical protein
LKRSIAKNVARKRKGGAGDAKNEVNSQFQAENTTI